MSDKQGWELKRLLSWTKNRLVNRPNRPRDPALRSFMAGIGVEWPDQETDEEGEEEEGSSGDDETSEEETEESDPEDNTPSGEPVDVAPRAVCPEPSTEEGGGMSCQGYTCTKVHTCAGSPNATSSTAMAPAAVTAVVNSPGSLVITPSPKTLVSEAVTPDPVPVPCLR